MKNISKILGYQPTIYIGDGHGIDTAGKRTPWIHGVGQIKENEFNKPVVDLFEKLATAVGFRVVQISPEDKEPGLSVRSGRVNKDFKTLRAANPGRPWHEIAIGVSVHFNAYNGKFDGKRGGVSVFASAKSPHGQRLAADVLRNLLHGYSQVSRGVKTNNLHMTRETLPVFILAECGFMDKLEEAKKMRDPGFQLETATELLAGACDYFGIEYEDLLKDPDPGHKIVADPSATIEQLTAWAIAKGAAPYFVDLIPVFWEVATEIGVDPVGQYVQSCKETGYGKFGGVLDATYKNPCGLKITQGGGNYDPHAHKRFKDWAEGIEAMRDHLALYAGAPGYPRKDSPDPRHFGWIKGVAPSFEDLSTRWAPSKTYGQSIVKMIQDVQAVKIVEPADPSPALEADIVKLKEKLAAATKRATTAEEKIEKIKAFISREV